MTRMYDNTLKTAEMLYISQTLRVTTRTRTHTPYQQFGSERILALQLSPKQSVDVYMHSDSRPLITVNVTLTACSSAMTLLLSAPCTKTRLWGFWSSCLVAGRWNWGWG